MTYRSKKDWRFLSLFITGSLALVGAGIALLMNPVPESARVAQSVIGFVLITFGAIVLAMSSWTYFWSSYEITPTHLIVRFGPFRPRYALASITEAIPTLVPLGPVWGFATCWDMVYIRLRHGLPLALSPESKTEFLRELTERVPGLVGDGPAGTSASRTPDPEPARPPGS